MHDCIVDGCQYEGGLFCIFCGLTEEDILEMDEDFLEEDYDDGFDYMYNRELEEEALGRPLFPNEY